MYWSKAKMEAHADEYVPSFNLKEKGGKHPKVSYADYVAGKVDSDDLWQYSSFWYKDFDAMAFKTMLRQLISKWGIMSIQMQSAFANDMAYRDTLEESEQPHYAGNAETIDADTGEVVAQEATASDNETAGTVEPSNSDAPRTAQNGATQESLI
jgi:recombination protein RecT